MDLLDWICNWNYHSATHSVVVSWSNISRDQYPIYLAWFLMYHCTKWYKTSTSVVFGCIWINILFIVLLFFCFDDAYKIYLPIMSNYLFWFRDCLLNLFILLFVYGTGLRYWYFTLHWFIILNKQLWFWLWLQFFIMESGRIVLNLLENTLQAHVFMHQKF